MLDSKSDEVEMRLFEKSVNEVDWGVNNALTNTGCELVGIEAGLGEVVTNTHIKWIIKEDLPWLIPASDTI